MPSKTAYRGKNKERPRAHGVHLVSESQNEGSIWACASSYPAHKREMPCIDSNTKRMMKTARKGIDSNTNCITSRHLRKYVHLRLQSTPKDTCYLHLHAVYITPIIKCLYIIGKRCIANWQTLEWAFD